MKDRTIFKLIEIFVGRKVAEPQRRRKVCQENFFRLNQREVRN